MTRIKTISQRRVSIHGHLTDEVFLSKDDLVSWLRERQITRLEDDNKIEAKVYKDLIQDLEGA